MKKRIIIFAICIAALGSTSASSGEIPCAADDRECVMFSQLYDDGQDEALIRRVDPKASYSAAARRIIGQSYLRLAGSESSTPEEEERYCRKALEYGVEAAYMGLYFLTVQQDPETALGFLRKYVTSDPPDAVPYVILGEAEFEKRNYRVADGYLRSAKQRGRGRSASLDWMLFQVNYLLGDYAFAAAMFESARSHGELRDEMKALSGDPRFQGIEKIPEFRKYAALFPPRQD